MKATVKKTGKRGEWKVEIQQGHQYFTLDYFAPKKECEWMAKMFRTALKDHDIKNFND